VTQPPPDAPAPVERTRPARRVWSALAIWRLFTRRIAGKIIWPYVFLFLCLAVLVTYIANDLITTALEDKYREELAGAGRSANEGMVLIERDSLRVLRQIIFTEGFEESVATRNTGSLQAILVPIATNEKISFVDIFLSISSRRMGDSSTRSGPHRSDRIRRP
jgi:hypothetical protein